MWLDEYPLTAAAAAARAAFDPLVDNPISECTPKGMPWIMNQPYPVEFTRDGDDILFHIEEYDLVRTVHMTPGAADDNVAPTLLGHSAGRWDGGRSGGRHPLGGLVSLAFRKAPPRGFRSGFP